MEEKNRAVLLHTVVWLQRLNGKGRPYPDTVLAPEILPGERLLRWTSHEDDDFTFALLEQAGLTGPPTPWSYDGMLHPLTFEAATLREELAADSRSASVDDLSLARAFAEQVLTSVGPQSEALGPGDESWFVPWDRLASAFDAFVAEGFAEREGNRYRFSRRLLVLMAQWGWRVELDPEARDRRLLDIWESMPAGLKEELTRDGSPSPLLLAALMGYLWDADTGWNPSNLALIDPDDLQLKGGHLPTAIAIVDLLGNRAAGQAARPTPPS